MLDLDFESDELRGIASPKLKREMEQVLSSLEALGLKDHFVLFSSGTTSVESKGYALARRALLTNAQAVNEHFNLSANDVWGLSIPWFHIGGLSVLARAKLTGSKMVDLAPWEPSRWTQQIHEKKVTITTIVPTQVFDLISKGLKAPPSLKYLVVGGDFLSSELEKAAIELGWPIIRTFGMTEISSQLASAKFVQGPLEVLPIHQIRITAEGQLLVKSPALFTLQFKLKDNLEIIWSKDLCDADGFYLTQDKVTLDQNGLHHLGRIDDQIKVAGKLMPLNTLKEQLYAFLLRKGCFGTMELIYEGDERLGKKLVLLHLPEVPFLAQAQELFSPLKPETRMVEAFERTDLGKLKRST
jgi:o-succinylbenzoate---CoA ligase